MLNNANRNISYAQQSKNITLPDPRVLYRLVMSEDLEKLFGPGPIHSDNWPLLEFASPKQMYTVDPTIGTNIRSKRWLSKETQNILGEITNVKGQIAFASFALSVYKPFRKMVDLLKATPEQKEYFFTIIEDFCARSLIKDYSIFTDKELKGKCLSTQIETIQNNIHLLSDKAVAYSLLGNAYDSRGEFQPAIECYQKTLAVNPNFAEAHSNLGVVYRKKGRLDEAISQYKKALIINPNLAEAHYNLGLIYDNKGMLDEAIYEYKKALAINPNSPNSHYNLGITYYNKGILDEAISEFKSTLAINPNYAEAHYNLGLVYNKKGMLNYAITEYKNAIAVNPNYAEAHYNLGFVYGKKGRLKEAIFHFKQTIAIKPNYAKAYNNLAWIYATSPNLAFRNGEEAVSLATKACELTKFNSASLLDTLAAAYAETGNFKKAIKYQNRAINLSQKEAKPALLKRLELYRSGQAYMPQ